jgi:hypothetical protein
LPILPQASRPGRCHPSPASFDDLDVTTVVAFGRGDKPDWWRYLQSGRLNPDLQFPTSLVRDVLPALVGAFPFLDGAS